MLAPDCLRVAREKLAEGYVVTLVPGRRDGEPCVHVRWVAAPQHPYSRALLWNAHPSMRAAYLICVASEARDAVAREGTML